MKRKILFMGMFLFAFLFLLQGGEAANTLNLTLANSISITGTFGVNYTVDAEDLIETAGFEYLGPTGISTYDIIANVTNTSAAQTEFTTDWITNSSIPDGTFTVRVSSYNATACLPLPAVKTL